MICLERRKVCPVGLLCFLNIWSYFTERYLIFINLQKQIIMNFKLNAWTLLFALAAGALLFNMYGKGTTDVAVEGDKCDGVTLDTIKTLDALEMRLGFLEYQDDSLFRAYEASAKAMGIVNPEVHSFHIPRCELDQMVAKFPGGDVTAYLTLKDVGNGKRQIDLIFSDKEKTSNVVELDKEVLAAKGGDLAALGGGAGSYWDFTKPCPDSCEE